MITLNVKITKISELVSKFFQLIAYACHSDVADFQWHILLSPVCMTTRRLNYFEFYNYFTRNWMAIIAITVIVYVALLTYRISFKSAGVRCDASPVSEILQK